MRKKILYLALALAGALALTGCGTNMAKKSYKASDYVELGEYTGLAVTQIEEKTELTDDEKEEAVYAALEDMEEELDVDYRSVEEYDNLSINYTCYQDGEVVDSTDGNPVDFQLGLYSYFDEEGEAQLIGANVGDTVTFDQTEESDEGTETYTYEVTIERVYVISVPDLTDELAQEKGYDSLEDMENAICQEELDSTNEEYRTYAAQDLVSQVKENSTFTGYPQEEFDEIKNQISDTYLEYFGVSLDELFGDDSESIDSLVTYEVNRILTIEAIAEKEKITVSKKELQAYKEQIVANADYGYSDVSELESETSDSELAAALLEEKVNEFLLSKAVITYVDEDEYYSYDDDSYDDDSYDDDSYDDDSYDDDSVEYTDDDIVIEEL